MTRKDALTIAIMDSGWVFDKVPPVTNPVSSFCGDVTPSMIADVPGFVKNTANSLVYHLALSVLSLNQGLNTIQMAL